MPPRFAYWTILAGGLPTSFRAADKDELMPTFRRLKEKHPDAEMKYFARGRLWESPEQARLALAPKPQQRGRDWRPGGDHRDPRQRFKDANKARNQDRRQQRWERKTDDRRAEVPKARPHGDPLAPRTDRHVNAKGSRQGDARPYKERPFDKPRGRSFGKSEGRPFHAAQGRPPRSKPHGDRFRTESPQRPFRPSTKRPFERNQEAPPRPPRPEREPPPSRDPKPEPPPRPSEPMIKPPGPPERGNRSRGRNNRPRRRDD